MRLRSRETPTTTPADVTTPRRRLSRRRAILGGSVAVVGLAGLGAGAVGGSVALGYRSARQSNVGDLTFDQPLAIPPVLDGTLDADGTWGYDLTARTGISAILPGKQTPTWGINGPFLAPTLRARRGQTLRPTVHNDLPDETTIHWHGMHLPATADGGAHQLIPPGGSWSPTWTVDQPAATLWYHPHPHGATAGQVYKGVAGMFLVEDDASDAAGLPRDYGVDDVPLILTDRYFEDDGRFREASPHFFSMFTGGANFGTLGDTILVNGTWNPGFTVTTTLVRFRLLNASMARTYAIGLTDDRAFHLVATDNGLLPAPVPLTRLPLSPGERAEIVVAFTPGEQVTLRSFAPDLGGDFFGQRAWGGDDVFDLVGFRAVATLAPSAPLPDRIAVDDATAEIPEVAAPVVRTLEMTNHDSMADVEFDMTRIDQVVAAGATEIWEVSGGDQMHVFHIHGASYRVLDVGGEAPPAHLLGLKDTVFVTKNRPVRLLIRFGAYADPAAPYMYHCHLLRHEDGGMMGQFVVVEPGTEATTPRTLPHLMTDGITAAPTGGSAHTTHGGGS